MSRWHVWLQVKMPVGPGCAHGPGRTSRRRRCGGAMMVPLACQRAPTRSRGAQPEALCQQRWLFFWKAHLIDQTYPRRHSANPPKEIHRVETLSSAGPGTLAPARPRCQWSLRLALAALRGGRRGPGVPAERLGSTSGRWPVRRAKLAPKWHRDLPQAPAAAREVQVAPAYVARRNE